MKLYCLNCNKPTDSPSGTPKFCSHCGKPYVNQSSASIIPISVSQPVIQQQNSRPTYIPSYNNSYRQPMPTHQNDDSNQDLQYVPRVEKINFDIDMSQYKPNRQNGEQVWKEGQAGIGINAPQRVVQKPKKLTKSEKQREIEITKQEFSKQILHNARNNRNSTEIGE